MATDGDGAVPGRRSSVAADLLDHEQDAHTKKLLIRFSQNKEAVERNDLEEFLQETQEQRNNFLKLPFSILFFLFFVMSVLAHENITDSSMVQRELRGMLTGSTFEGIAYTSGHKDFHDIDTKEDIYTFVNEVVLPLFINPANTPAEERHRVLRYNQIIGGLQLQQVRRKKISCSTEYPDLGPFPRNGRTNPVLSDFGCYPWYTESDDCFGPWNRTARDNLPGGFCPDSKKDLEQGYGLSPRRRLLDSLINDERRLDFVPDGGGTGGSSKGARSDPGPDQLFTVYMYEHEGLAVAQQKLSLLQQNGWIDYQTAWFGIRLFVLNPDLAIFVHVTVHVYFPPSGALLPHITAQSFQPEPYQYMSVIALDATWLALLVWLMFSLMLRLYKAVKKEECMGFVLNVWNWLDLGMVVAGLCVAMLWLILLDELVDVKQKALDVKSQEPGPNFISDTYPKMVAALHIKLTEISGYLTTMRLVFCWYTVLISMKFLESFSAQPRLAVVTKTIYYAGSDLFHFLIVLFIIFMSYCIAGMFLFGRRLWSFSTMQYTITTCFLMMLGDFDWEELGEEHPLTAGLWFWTYMVVMTLLMLNMLMAIIMDKYTEVKSDASEHAPIWTQCAHMFMELLNRAIGRSVGHLELLRAVQDMSENEVNEDILVDAVGPALSREQARDLIKTAQARVDSQLDKGVTMSEAMRMIGWVKIAVQKIGWKLEEIIEEEKEEQGMLQRTAHGYDPMEELSTGPGMEPLPEFDFGAPLTGMNISNASAASRGSHLSHASHVSRPVPILDTSFRDMPPTIGEAVGATSFVAEAEQRLERIEQRMAKMDDFMQEALQYTTFRGKDLRNRLAVIEELIRSQRDATMDHVDRNVWDQMPPRFGGGVGPQSFAV